MLALAGVGCIVAAFVAAWLFIGTQVRADRRGGGTSRVTRRSGWWLLASVALSAVGVALLIAHVVGLWL